ncbi:MAG: class I SAM-dependent methyltransferase [Elusimicrobia bacterium]|nr:class I SAM-dependent methyltransferase [Elusimicrobiota bacterium]
MSQTKTESRELFDEHAHNYDALIPRHIQSHYLEKRAAFLKNLLAGGRVLDAGCGTTVLMERIKREGYAVFGIDESLTMLKQSSSCKNLVLQGDLARLPYQNETFDLVYSVAVFHHIGDAGRIAATLGEMARITKKRGKIVIWDHNPRNPYWKFFMKKLPWDNHVHRLIGAREIRKGFESAGVSNVEVYLSGLVPDFARESQLGFWRRLERCVEKNILLRNFCAHHMVVGHK